MTWTPSDLTREQLEERRLEGGRLLRAGQRSDGRVLLRLRDEGAYSSQSLDQALRVLDAEQIGVEMRGGSLG